VLGSFPPFLAMKRLGYSGLVPSRPPLLPAYCYNRLVKSGSLSIPPADDLQIAAYPANRDIPAMAAVDTAASSDRVAASAALDAMVLGERRVVSFRALSSALSLPTTSAKAVLRDYVAAHASAADLAVIWAVTLDASTSAASTSAPFPAACVALTRAPHPGPTQLDGRAVRSATVWAVSAAGAAPAGAAHWAAADRAREIEMVRAPPADVNELRDGRFAMYRSKTSAWTVGASGEASNRPTSAARGESDGAGGAATKAMPSLLERAKATAAEREKAQSRVLCLRLLIAQRILLRHRWLQKRR
jgi:hypothetical protein